MNEVAARRLEEWGYREIVVSGVLLGSYGRDLPDAPCLRDLLAGLLEGTREARIRVSSVEPQDVDRDLFALWRNPRLCRHLHLPLQSGSTAILQAMRRQYSAEWYAELVQSAVADIPGVAITVDVMVGFPGEDERLFDESYRLVEDRTLCVTVNMPHGHHQGWAPAEIGLFVDQHLRQGKPLARVEAMKRDGNGVEVTFRSGVAVTGARLHYTTDGGPWQKRKWQTREAKVDGRK